MCADIIGKKTNLLSKQAVNWGIEAVHRYLEPEEIGHMCCRIESEVCFVYVVRGEILMQMNQECMPVGAGAGIFINSGVPYRFAGSVDGACELYHIRINMKQAAEEELGRRFVNPVLECADYPYQLLVPEKMEHMRMLEKLKHMAESVSTQSICLEMEMKGCLYELWSGVYACFEKCEKARKMFLRETEKLKRMLVYIHEHYTDKVTLSELADNLGISTGDYCRFFKKHMGQTPFEYLQMYRIEKSIPELLGKTAGIAEIAGKHGFHGASYYTETFRKEMGCNPGEYRKWFLDLRKGDCPLKKVRVGTESCVYHDKEESCRKVERQDMPMHLL